jgi:hypothetical protein
MRPLAGVKNRSRTCSKAGRQKESGPQIEQDPSHSEW